MGLGDLSDGILCDVDVLLEAIRFLAGELVEDLLYRRLVSTAEGGLLEETVDASDDHRSGFVDDLDRGGVERIAVVVSCIARRRRLLEVLIDPVSIAERRPLQELAADREAVQHPERKPVLLCADGPVYEQVAAAIRLGSVVHDHDDRSDECHQAGDDCDDDHLERGPEDRPGDEADDDRDAAQDDERSDHRLEQLDQLGVERQADRLVVFLVEPVLLFRYRVGEQCHLQSFRLGDED